MASAVRRPVNRVTLIVTGLIVALLVAMVLNTRFLTPEELAASLPEEFDPQATAAELFEQAQGELPGRAADLGDVVAGIQDDPVAAAEEFGATSPSEGTYVFAVTTTSTAEEVSPTAITLAVDGVPDETTVTVPLGTAINGTVLRDAMGFGFADAPGQTDFQYVGDELKKLVQAEIAETTPDVTALDGEDVEVVGVLSVVTTSGRGVPPAKPVVVQPLTVKAA